MEIDCVCQPATDVVAAAQAAVTAATTASDADSELVGRVGEMIASRSDAVATVATAFAIRRAVFTAAQGIEPDLECDDAEPDAIHLVGVANAEPVGTARIRRVTPETAKIERVAIRQPNRSEGTQSDDAAA